MALTGVNSETGQVVTDGLNSETGDLVDDGGFESASGLTVSGEGGSRVRLLPLLGVGR